MNMKMLGWGTTGVGVITTGAGLSRKSWPVAGAGAVITAIGALLIISEAAAAPPPPPEDTAQILAFTVSKA
jgi:hypothetical protein